MHAQEYTNQPYSAWNVCHPSPMFPTKWSQGRRSSHVYRKTRNQAFNRIILSWFDSVRDVINEKVNPCIPRFQERRTQDCGNPGKWNGLCGRRILCKNIGQFFVYKARSALTWPWLTSIWCQGSDCMELYIHSPLCLHMSWIIKTQG